MQDKPARAWEVTITCVKTCIRRRLVGQGGENVQKCKSALIPLPRECRQRARVRAFARVSGLELLSVVQWSEPLAGTEMLPACLSACLAPSDASAAVWMAAANQLGSARAVAHVRSLAGTDACTRAGSLARSLPACDVSRNVLPSTPVALATAFPLTSIWSF